MVKQADKRIREAMNILNALGFPANLINEMSAVSLLALLDLKPRDDWPAASSPLMGVTPIMEFAAKHYGKVYKPNTRETFRKNCVQYFVEAGP